MSGSLDPRTPIIVWAGQETARVFPADEPVGLLAEVLSRIDTPGLRKIVDSVQVVAIGTRRYTNPARLVADSAGIRASHLALSTHGGQSPQSLVARAAWDLWTGRFRAVAIGGAESWRTRRLMRKAGTATGWTVQENDEPDATIGLPLRMATTHEQSLGFGDPLDAYPMLETALRHELGHDVGEHDRYLAHLWADFNAVAATNPHAALRGTVSAEVIGEVGQTNRRVSYPYPKLMTANNDVDQAAALIMTTVEHAQALRIPKDDWVFLHGVGEAVDCDSFTARASYTRSEAIRKAVAAALSQAGLHIEEVSHLDLYSCFPSAVQIAAREAGVPMSKRLTVTGGLTFAGGPWNNYVTHALATMVDVLRNDPEDYGLVTANGGLLTKHAVGVYSCTPSPMPPREPSIDRSFATTPVHETFDGDAEIAAYTVRYRSDGTANHAFAVCRTPDDHHILVRTDDEMVAAKLALDDYVGQRVQVQNTTLAGI